MMLCLPILAHPRLHRDGTKSYVPCGPHCLEDLYSLDDDTLAWLVRNGAAYLETALIDGLEGDSDGN